MRNHYRSGGSAGQLRFREKYRQPKATGKTAIEALDIVLGRMEEAYKKERLEKAAKEVLEGKP